MSKRFFTNEGENTLLKKFAGVFAHNPDIERFDALVGYLRASGYFALRPHLEKVPLIRIIVGIDVDDQLARHHRKGLLMLGDADKTLAFVRDKLAEDVQGAPYRRDVEEGIRQFVADDGQQRLRAIFEFHAGEFSLPKESDPIEGVDPSKLKYADLPDDLRLKFDTYSLDVIVLTNTDEDEVREMFLRLQNGTTLKAQERRNAMPGMMRAFIKELASHPFFGHCAFANSRFTFDLVAAQVTALELNGGPCNVKNANLNSMYEEQVDFDVSSPKAKKVRRVLDYLLEVFPEKTPELERFSVVSLYSLVSHCLEKYVMQGRQTQLREWFIAFESERAKQEDVQEDKRDTDYLSYKERTSHSTDAEDSLEWRQDFLLRKFFETVQDIQQKDDQRLFSREQRLAIFRRDGGICQVKVKCIGAKCEWDAWEADHIKPWSKGGKTIVVNGQVACLGCNSAKGAGA